MTITSEQPKTYTVNLPLDGKQADSLGGDLYVQFVDSRVDYEEEDYDDYPVSQELTNKLPRKWLGNDANNPIIKIRGRRYEQLTLTKEALELLIFYIDDATQHFRGLDYDLSDPNDRAYKEFGKRLLENLTHTLNGTTPPPKPPKPKSLTTKQRQKLTKERHKQLTKEAQRIWKTMEQWHHGKPLPEIKISYTRKRNKKGHGFARNMGKPGGCIQIDIPTEIPDQNQWWHWAVLTHELAHHACPPIKATTGKGYRYNTHHRIFYYCIRHAWEKRWKCDIRFGEVKTWGYSVDRIIEKQAHQHITFTLPNPTPK